MTAPNTMTPEGREISTEERERRRIERRRPILRGVALSLIVFSFLFAAFAYGNSLIQQKAQNSVSDQIATVQSDLKNVCRKVPDPQLSPGERDQCQRAEQSAPPVPPATVTVVQPAPAAGLTVAEVRDIVRGEIAGKSVTVDEVLDLVQATYAANPPAPGRGPTQDETFAAVQAVCAEGACQGKDGTNATDEQVAASVADYCSSRNDCRGADSTIPGPEGKQGERGAPAVEFSWTASDDCTILGCEQHTHVCSRNNEDDSNPTYSCT